MIESQLVPGAIAESPSRKQSKPLGERAVSISARVFFRLLKRMSFLGGIDLPLLLENNLEQVLNLPGSLSFFPSKATDVEKVKEFLTVLHPVSSPTGLVRLGPDRDGGYLVPNDLEGVEMCFSPGVSNESGFELDCAKRGMTVFMADASVVSPSVQHPNFRFIRKFIGRRTLGEFISLEDWVNDLAGDLQRDLMLQMDIEGYEYETLLATPSKLLERFRIIVIEFHYLDYLFCEPLFNLHRIAFEKILSTHVCVHIHPNNVFNPIRVQGLELPQMAEFTFLRRDRVGTLMPARVFPHPLDRDNTPEPTYVLPSSLYSAE